MSVTATWTNPASSPPDLVTGQTLTQTAWEEVLSNLLFLGGVAGSGGSVGGVPSGSLVAYGAGTTDPAGWFLCDGRAVSRTTYAALFTIIGTTYGAGDGSTTFNLPDFRSRVPMGADNMGSSAGAAGRASGSVALGNASGEDTHLLTSTESGLQSHTHGNSLNDGGHFHGETYGGPGSGSVSAVSGDNNAASVQQNPTANNTTTVVTGMSITNAAVSAANAGGAHNNRQLVQIANWIIKQ